MFKWNKINFRNKRWERAEINADRYTDMHEYQKFARANGFTHVLEYEVHQSVNFGELLRGRENAYAGDNDYWVIFAQGLIRTGYFENAMLFSDATHTRICVVAHVRPKNIIDIADCRALKGFCDTHRVRYANLGESWYIPHTEMIAYFADNVQVACA